MPNCTHPAKSKYRCTELSLQDVTKIHRQYYKGSDLQSKRNLILQNAIVSSAKRTRLPEGIDSKRNVSTEFFLPKQRNDKIVNVKKYAKQYFSKFYKKVKTEYSLLVKSIFKQARCHQKLGEVHVK